LNRQPRLGPVIGQIFVTFESFIVQLLWFYSLPLDHKY